ncbi:ricin-type beta-trefoil lectin domain protein [Streptomyces sp. NPDC002463]|uniref:ricin-type beta-trefoil lectin domain protein n=1 Tax=Streptomyces sp. NPDC002463 TaxID=3364645 RepID=UPI0036C044C4
MNRWTVALTLLALLLPQGVAQGLGPGFSPDDDNVGAAARAGAGRYAFKGDVWNPKELAATPAVGHHTLSPKSPAHPRGYKPLDAYHVVEPAWPKPGTVTVPLTRAADTGTRGARATGTDAKSTTRSAGTSAPVAGSAVPSPGVPSSAASTPPSESPKTAPAESDADSGRTVPVAGPVKAGSLPVWIAPAATVRHQSSTAESGPAAVRVQVASHAQTLRAGANGMLVALSRPDAQAPSDRIQVVIDYAQLAKAYGGGYGSRLQLRQLPACAMTTPQLAACRTQTPIAFTNRPAAHQLTAVITLTATAPDGPSLPGRSLAPQTLSAESTTLAVTSGSAGSQGSYTATSLAPSGSWQTSGTGSYTYSYPIDVPAGVGGSSPSVALSYDSQSVDGETSARNSQSSWIGDGWSYQPGFVERGYRGCGSLLDGNGDKILKGSGDQCWGGDNAQMSFGSHSGTLVPDGIDSSVPGEIKQWRLQGDDGTIVQELSGAANGLYDGVYYRVLTTDGTAAYFGSDHAPVGVGAAGVPQAGAPTDASTQAAWGLPVLHPRSGDPCYNPTKGKASRCDKPEGWRWNLDFVVAPNGMVQRYDYNTQTNYYDLGGGQAATGETGTLTSYTRGGLLESISYGYTLADALAEHTPAAQVVFASKQRCQTTGSFTDCSAGNLNDTTAPHWPDVPWDLHCDATDSTKIPDGATSVPTDVCVVSGPTFWTTTRLDGITTKVHVMEGATDKGLIAVDSYQLGHVFSDAGGTVDPVTGTTVDPVDAGSLQAVMWLQSIKHTGKDTYNNGNSDLSTNEVSFTGTEIDNRVNDNRPSAPPLFHPRISSIQTETGESIAVEYNATPCAGKSLSFATADSNTDSCYPEYWTVPGASKPIADWFNKTTVHAVTVADLTIASQYKPDAQNIPAGSEIQTSTYSYAGAAWHRDDSALTDDQYRTWNQFRGFRTVTVQTGQAPEPVTRQTTTYLQGMNGDYRADGSRRVVSVDATVGGSTVLSVTDADQLAGTALQSDSYTAAGGSVNAVTVKGPFTDTTTASAAQSPWSDWTQEDNPGETRPPLSTLPALAAHRIKTRQTHGYSLLADGTWRHTRTDAAYDDEGRLISVDAHGDVKDTSQEKCSTTSYATPPASNPHMLSYPDQTTTVSGPCGTVAGAATLLADKKIYYGGDGTLANLGTFGQLTATGAPTAVRVATGYTGTTENWQTTVAMKYDGAGRITDAVDATSQNTHTDYLPAWNDNGGNTNPRSIESTNSQNWKVTSTLDALRGLPTRNVDVNGRITDITYDALGRRTAVWLPGRNKADGKTADMTFAYSINPGAVAAPGGTITQPGAPSTVTTKTLREDETYATSISIYDGMLQPRQTQATAQGDSDTGRIISDTFYDSHGWPIASFAPYSEPNNPPSTTLYAANENQIPSETTTAYDGQGRPVTSTLWHQAVRQWDTSTSYPGADETDTTAVAGGRSTATFTNALGQTTRSVVKNPGSTVTLTGGQVIPSGTSLTSNSVRLTMQGDGNLVLSALASGKTIWSSGTGGNTGAYARFGTDGNLVVYNTSGTAKFTTNLSATAGATLRVHTDSTLSIVAADGRTVLWKQGTPGAVVAADATTRYTYTPAGQVSTVKDTAGNTWSYSYNLLGQKTSQTDPNAGTSTFDKYDVAGNLLQSTDARGQVLSFAYDWDDRKTASYAAPWSATPDPAKQLTSWTYDTLAKGYPTSSTRYVGGNTTTGKAYTKAVTSYDTAYQALGSTLTIPAADGFAAAGQSAAPTSGTVTYTATATYTPTLGKLASTHYQADGNLPAETVDYGYTQTGNLTGIGGFLSNADTPAYLDTAVHDPFGRVKQANYGPTGKELATFAQYDATTGRVTQTSSMLQTQTTALDVVNYRYNQAAEITAIDDLRDNTTHDTQCFTYDSFQRLTAAWTDTAGITSPSSAPVGSVGGCNTSRVQTTAAPVKTTTVGGPAAYWQSYIYDQLGDRTGMVNHDTSGNAVNNTTQTISYPGADGTVAATLPDQGGAASSLNPSTGTTTITPTYADTTTGKNAGNTVKRTNSYTGQLLATIKTTTGANLCLTDPANATVDGTVQTINTCGITGQSYTVALDGTVKIQGKCLDTAGGATGNSTKVVITTCNTAIATQKWKTTTTKTLVNVGSGRCLADPAGNQTPGTQLILWDCKTTTDQQWSTPTNNTSIPAGQSQSLAYDSEGRTASVSTTSGTSTVNTSKYLYDADGGLLEQTSAVGSTDTTRILYLFGGTEQITQNVAGKTWTGLRNYAGPDGTRITRSSTGSLTYQVTNAQGTATTAIDATSLAVTRRSFDPYGNPRGTKPTSWVAPDENRGFLGRPTDTTTGLDLLGARNYDPTLGRFLTPDPLFEAGDPNQMGGYTYAGDNPATSSDANGLESCYPVYCSGDHGTYGNKPPIPPGGGSSSTNTSSGSTGGGSTGGGSGSGSTPSPSPGPAPTPPPPGAVDEGCGGVPILVSLGCGIVVAAASLVTCEFWLSGGGADHDQACEMAGGVISGGGLEGSVPAVAEGGIEGAVEEGGAAVAEGDAAVVAGAGAKAVDEAASDAADLVALKRANAQAQAEKAAAETARADDPAVGSPGVKPSARDSRAPARKGNPGSKASSKAVVSKTRLPRGTSIEDGLAGARNLRNRVAHRTLFPDGGRIPASMGLAKKTWSAGYNAETGEIAVASSGCGYCAEGNVINALGGDANRVVLTRALTWDMKLGAWDEMPICQVCQTYLTPEDVEPGAWYMHPGEWDNR